MDDQILSLEHISLSYHTMKGETPALCDLTFSVKPGEFVALVGPSGCGKSTILNLISGLLKPEAGTLLSRGRPITEADLHIGYMLQRDHLFEWRTIYSNVLLGLEISRTLTPERKEKVGEMMETYGLKSFSNARPSELSGGMRQRAALIRTLAMEPDLLLLDEPFSALDYQTRLNVCDERGKSHVPRSGHEDGGHPFRSRFPFSPGILSCSLCAMLLVTWHHGFPYSNPTGISQ